MNIGWKWPVIALAGIAMSAGVYTQVDAQTKVRTQVNLSRKVTKSFTNAKLDDVLAWLKGQGVSFVVRSGVANKDARLTLNAVDQPLENVIESIARAFDAQWTREGKVWVLKPGNTVFWGGDAGLRSPFTMKDEGELQKLEMRLKELPELKMPPFELKDMPPMPDMKLEELKGLKDMELNLKDMPDMHFLKDLPNGQVITDEDLKKNPELKKKLEMFEKEAQLWGEKFSKEWEGKSKDWEAWAEKFGKQWEGQSKDWEAWGEKFSKDWEGKGKEWEAFGKQMEEKAKQMEKFAQDWEKKHGKNDAQLKAEIEKRFGKDFKFDFNGQLDKEWAAKMEVDAKKWAEKSKDLAKELGGQSGNWTILQESNVKDLLKSLTDEQKAQMKSRGYLVPSDLTDEQRKFINLPRDGEWSFTYSIDGETVTIKSK